MQPHRRRPKATTEPGPGPARFNPVGVQAQTHAVAGKPRGTDPGEQDPNQDSHRRYGTDDAAQARTQRVGR